MPIDQSVDRGRVKELRLARTGGSLLAVAGYALLRLWAAVSPSPGIFPDSADYARVAHLTVFDPHFYGANRSWGLPLLWKLVPGPARIENGQPVFTDVAPVVVAQALLSVAAWLFLAWTVASLFPSRVARLLAASAVLAFSLSSAITAWDSALLSESLSLSLLAVAVAVLIRLVARPSRLGVAGALLALLLWSFTRDTNSWYALLLVPVIAVVLLRRDRRQLALALVVGALTLVGLVQLSFANGHRGDLPIQNAMVLQSMTHQEVYGYFASRGLPVPPDSMPLLAERPVSLMQHDPRLAEFRAWFSREGRTSYLLFLAARPDISLGEPLRHLGRFVAPSTSQLAVYHDSRERSLFPVWLDEILYPRSGALMGAFALLTLLGAGLLLRRRELAAVAVVPAAMLVAIVPVGVIVWNADGVELDRHLAGGAVMAHLAVLLLGCLAGERLVASAYEHTPSLRADLLPAAAE